VQSYSSGMNIRLGFSIATALMPDVLLLDEVLAVGDASFRFKCHRRIIDVLKNAAVIFVSHDIPHIARLCDQTMVLKQGEVHFLGETSLGVENYRTLNEKGIPVEEGFLTLKPPISNFEIGIDSKEIRSGNPMNVEILLESSLEVDNLALRINIFNLAGAYAADCIVNSMEYLNKVKQGINKWQIEVTSLPLKAGRYQLLFSVADNDGDFLAVSYKHHEITITGGCPGTVADCQLALRSWITY
jgi:lipopolysaccharide transport system ATP-binding protein